MAYDYASALIETPEDTSEDTQTSTSGYDYSSALLGGDSQATETQPSIAQKTGQFGLPTLDALDNFIENDPSPLAEHFRKQSEGQLIKFGGGVTRVGQGVKQSALGVLEEFNLVDPGTTKAYTELTEREKKFIDQQFNAEFGDNPMFAIADVAGEAAPFATLPAGGKTKLARTVLGAVSGAIAGNAMFVDSDGNTKAENTAIGAASGAVLSPLLEVVPGVKNFFKRYIGLSPKSEKIKKLSDISLYEGKQNFIDRGLFISDKTGVKFKLSQITGDSTTEAMERLARQGKRGEELARENETKQVGQVLKYWNRTLPKLTRDEGDFGVKVKAAFDNTIGDSKKGTGLLGARKLDAKRNFKAVDAALGTNGKIPISEFTKSVDEIIAQNSQRGATPRQLALAKNLQSILDDFADNPNVNASELQNLLTTYGDAAQGSGRIFTDEVDNIKDKAVARKLLASLKKDMDSAINSGIPGANDLKIARDSYNAHTQAINDVRDTALGKLFNKKTKPTGESIAEAFMKMKPAEITSSLQILSTSNPEIAQSAKRFFLKSYLDKAKVSGQADALGFVPAKMLDMLKDRERFKAMFPGKDARLMVMNGIEATRRIMLNNFRTGGRTLPRAKELAGVIASRDKTFVARLAADILSPEVVSRALLTEEGIRGLQQLSTPYNQNRWSAGLVAISNAIKDNIDAEEQQ